ncbi:hypothetical protein GCM10022222_35710 [Amycolatopsis ultiminotia]|uniref:Uncharacterized protein n=1 Tax=Amycolatopsis ultiminotia TaxID=543629 RepID=A0ABP6WBA2_9PSEU
MPDSPRRPYQPPEQAFLDGNGANGLVLATVNHCRDLREHVSMAWADRAGTGASGPLGPGARSAPRASPAAVSGTGGPACPQTPGHRSPPGRTAVWVTNR